MKQIKMIVFGNVQGVGFRYTTKLIADTLSIHGYAKNLLDGSVEILAEGKEEDIQKFIKKIKNSPSPYSKVTHYQLTYIHNTNFPSQFKIY